MGLSIHDYLPFQTYLQSAYNVVYKPIGYFKNYAIFYNCFFINNLKYISQISRV